MSVSVSQDNVDNLLGYHAGCIAQYDQAFTALAAEFAAGPTQALEARVAAADYPAKIAFVRALKAHFSAEAGCHQKGLSLACMCLRDRTSPGFLDDVV